MTRKYLRSNIYQYVVTCTGIFILSAIYFSFLLIILKYNVIIKIVLNWITDWRDNFNTFRFSSRKVPDHSPVFEAYSEECLRYVVPPDIESYKFLRFQWIEDKFDRCSKLHVDVEDISRMIDAHSEFSFCV